MLLIPTYQPRFPRLCTYAIQMLQSWWYINFTYKVMSFLDTAGICVLVMACLLYRFEKTLFDYDCYGTVYNTGSILCSCISSLLPSSCRPTYSYQPRQRHRPRRRRSNGLNFSYRLHPQTRTTKLITKSPFYMVPQFTFHVLFPYTIGPQPSSIRGNANVSDIGPSLLKI